MTFDFAALSTRHLSTWLTAPWLPEHGRAHSSPDDVRSVSVSASGARSLSVRIKCAEQAALFVDSHR